MQNANYLIIDIGIAVAIILILGVALIFWNNHRIRQNYAKQSSGKLLCRFYSPEGSFPELCDVWKGMVRKMEHATRGTFSSARWVNAPEGTEQNTDIYLVLQDHCFPVRWPEGKPYSQQIIVMETSYIIGDPIPQITYNPSAWDVDKYTRVTTAIMKYAFDEKTMQAITSALGDIEGRIQKLINYLKMVPIQFIVLGAIALLCIISTVSSCQARSAAKDILQFIHPK